METLSSRELMQATGLSTRQLDYWTTNNVIKPLGNNNPGSGYYRRFDPAIVPKVALLVKISYIFNRNYSLTLLRKIYAHYDEGKVELAEGVFISW